MIEREVIGSKGNIYTVVIEEKPFGMSCSCRAGQMGQLCKHILNLIEEDKEIANIFNQSDCKQYYDEYQNLSIKAEEIKKLANAKKKQLARELLF